MGRGTGRSEREDRRHTVENGRTGGKRCSGGTCGREKRKENEAEQLV